MHPNKTFRSATSEQNLDFAQNRGFGALTLSGPDGPLASHIPFVLSADKSSFGAHLVRSNSLLKLIEKPQPALMIISGPDGYISPDWYGIEDQVPTWNYVAVHLYGTVLRLPNEALRPHLEALSNQFEIRLAPKPVWKLDKVNSDALSKMQRSIVPIQFNIDRVEGTWKLGQNKAPVVQKNAARKMSSSPREQHLGQMIDALALLMQDGDV